MPRQRAPQPPDVVTIREAAALLGVSMPTLRRWDAKGKFAARRHPINGYRIYSRRAVLRLRNEIAATVLEG